MKHCRIAASRPSGQNRFADKIFAGRIARQPRERRACTRLRPPQKTDRELPRPASARKRPAGNAHGPAAGGRTEEPFSYHYTTPPPSRARRPESPGQLLAKTHNLRNRFWSDCSPAPSGFPHQIPYLVLKTRIIHNTFHNAVENPGRKSERETAPNPKRARRRGFPRGAPAGHGKRKDLSRRVAAWQSATAAEEAYCGQRTAKRGKDRSSARYCSTQRAKAQAVDFLTLRRSGGVRPAGRGCRPGPARRGPAAF